MLAMLFRTLPFRTGAPPVLLLTLILSAGLLAGCGGTGGEEATPAADDAGTAPQAAEDDARRYEVRGEITAVPDPEDPLSNLVIRHEAIDDFVSFEGEVVGMSSMSMPFPVADDVSLEGVEVGDKVEFTLLVDWEGDPAYQVVRLEELPADTELEYRKAQPPDSVQEDVAEGMTGEVEMEAGGDADEGTP